MDGLIEIPAGAVLDDLQREEAGLDENPSGEPHGDKKVLRKRRHAQRPTT